MNENLGEMLDILNKFNVVHAPGDEGKKW